MRRVRWVIVALLLAPLAAVAQTPPPVQVGSRVRIWHHCAPACQRVTGTVVRLTPDSILLNADNQFSPTAIARGSVSTFEVANGRKSLALVGAGAGFLIGSTVGLLIGTAVDPPDNDIMASMDIARGATIPHVRSPDKLPETLDEMGQKLSAEHIQFDPESVKDGLRIRFGERAAFKPGSIELNSALRKALIEPAKVLENYSFMVAVEGFTDSQFKPSPSYPTPAALSCARASSTRTAAI